MCGLVGRARCLTVRYEDLVTNTENILRQVAAWLGLAWDPVMLRHHEVLELVETSHLETTADQAEWSTLIGRGPSRYCALIGLIMMLMMPSLMP